MLSEAIADDAVRNVPPVLLGKTTGMKRKSISKRLRFEIFKRDGFKCVHCGASPQSGPMHLDHLKPVAQGGDESAENLVTACVDCNLGKGPVPLELVKLRRGKATEAQREHAAQLREWLAIQRDVVQAKGEFEEMLEAEWEKRCGSLQRGVGTRLKSAVEEFGMERTMEAIEITSSAMWATSENRQVRYFHGVLKRFREGKAPTKREEPRQQEPEFEPEPSRQCMVARAAMHEAVAHVNSAEFKGGITRHIATSVAASLCCLRDLGELDDERLGEFAQEGIALGGVILCGQREPDGKSVRWSVRDRRGGYNPWEHAFDEPHSHIIGLFSPGPDVPEEEWAHSPTAIVDAYSKARELEEWVYAYEAVGLKGGK